MYLYSLFFIFLLFPLYFSKKQPLQLGIAVSAYQTEGAWLADNKSMTFFDNFAHTLGKIEDGTNADIAANSYYWFEQDIALMKQYNIKHYRMSISWSRVIPLAREGAPINMKAVEHYRKMLLAIKDAGIIAYANLMHQDLPGPLTIFGIGKGDQDFHKHYAYYVDIAFQYFGDLVPYWFTFDEPWCESVFEELEKEDEGTMPYLIGHELLLAHSMAVKIYREKYQKKFGGKIGVNLFSDMGWPKNASNIKDVEATERWFDFQLGWFAEPLINGEYPEIMRKRLGNRLPVFTKEEKEMVKGAIDFFAVNHYGAFLGSDGDSEDQENYWDDVNVTQGFDPSWKKTDMGWAIVPYAIHDLLIKIKNRWFKNSTIQIMVTENGVAVSEKNISSALNDHERIAYVHDYVEQIAKAQDEGVNVTHYFLWSLLDNFEWTLGLQKRFGTVRIEYGKEPKRIPKSSIKWYSQVINDQAQ